MEVSPSGNGIKAWMDAEYPREISTNRYEVHKEQEQRVEVYSDGRYFTVTGRAWRRDDGTIGPSTLPKSADQFNQVIDYLDETWPKKSPTKAPAASIPSHRADPGHWPTIEERKERAIQYLRSVPEAISGSGGQNQTMSAAGAVAVGFALDDQQTYEALDAEWNQRCVPPWEERELSRKISEARKTSQKHDGYMFDDDASYQRASGPVVDLSGLTAGSQGSDAAADDDAVGDASQVQPGADAAERASRERWELWWSHVKSPESKELSSRIVRFNDAAIGAAIQLQALQKRSQQQASASPTRLPVPRDGFLKDFMQFIDRNAVKQQPAFSQLGAIATQGTLSGRKVQTDDKQHANLYFVCLGGTSTGKDVPRQAVKELLVQVDPQNYLLADKVSSSTALLRDLARKPSGLWMPDEFNKVLGQMKDQKQHWMGEIVATNLELWSAPNQPFWARAMADQRFNIEIPRPHLSIYATGTPDEAFENITTSDISNGLLGRCLIAMGDDQAVKVRRGVGKDKRQLEEIPEQVLRFARAWNNPCPLGTGAKGSLQDIFPPLYTVGYTEQADHLFDWFDDDCERRNNLDGELGVLWARATEKARRLALISACSRYEVLADRGGINFAAITIDEIDAQWAVEVVSIMTEGMVDAISSRVAKSRRELDLKSIERFIKASGTAGVTKSAITNKFGNIPLKAREELLADLVVGDKVVADPNKNTKGRPSVTYYHASFAQQKTG
jgi:hypothetical protein